MFIFKLVLSTYNLGIVSSYYAEQQIGKLGKLKKNTWRISLGVLYQTNNTKPFWNFIKISPERSAGSSNTIPW